MWPTWPHLLGVLLAPDIEQSCGNSGSSPSTSEAHDRKVLGGGTVLSKGSLRNGNSHRPPFLLSRREKTVLQSTNRKLERKVKELSIQIEDERQHVNDQKDQVRTWPSVDKQPRGKYMFFSRPEEATIPNVFRT